MKKIGRFFSVVCAAVLAVSGLSVIPGTSSLTSIRARAEVDYDCSIECDSTDMYLDDDPREFSASIVNDEGEDAEEAGSSITYSWSLLEGGEAFEFAGATDEKSVLLAVKEGAEDLLKNEAFVPANLQVRAEIDGFYTIVDYIEVRLIDDEYYEYNQIQLDNDSYAYGEGHTSATFTLKGLDRVNSYYVENTEVSPTNLPDYYDDFDMDDYFEVDKTKTTSVTIKLKNGAVEKWKAFVEAHAGDGIEDHLEAEYIFLVYKKSGAKNPVEVRAFLTFYPDNIRSGLRLSYISDGSDSKDDFIEFTPDSEPVTLEAMFNMEDLVEEADVIYEWSMDEDARKFFDFVTPISSKSVKVKLRDDAIKNLNGAFDVTGDIAVYAAVDDVEDEMHRMLRFEAASPEIICEKDMVFDNDHRTREFKVTDIDKLDGKLDYDWTEDRDKDLGPKIFDIQIKGSRVIVTVQKDADKIIRSEEYKHYLEEDDTNGDLYYYATTDWWFGNSENQTEIGVVSFWYYPDGIYEIEFSSTRLVFNNKEAKELKLTANVEGITGKQVKYDWHFDSDDGEIGDYFTLENADKKTVTIKYNGKLVDQGLTYLYLALLVDGKKVTTSQFWVEITVQGAVDPIDPEDPDNPDKPDPIDPDKPDPIDPDKPDPVDPDKPDPVNPDPINPDKPDDGKGQTKTDPAKQVNDPTAPAQGQAAPAPVGTTISAQESGTNGVYEVTSSADGAATVKFKGLSNKKAKKVSIPASIHDGNGVNYTVTEVAPGALKKNGNVQNVTMGKYIKKIGKNAFNGCKKLKKITVNGNTLTSVGKGAFKGIFKNAHITVIAKNKKVYDKAVKILKKGGATGCSFKFRKG